MTAWKADYPGATVRDIPSSAWSMADREADLDISTIIIHYTQGTSFAPIAFGPGGLAHYGVSDSGAVDQYINERYVAWHAGNWPVNQHSVGIEHTGFGRPQDWTEAKLRASAKLTADICRRRNIPADRNHIKGHNEVSGPGGHTDPGPNFPWTRYMQLAVDYLRGGDPTPPKPEPEKPEPEKPEPEKPEPEKPEPPKPPKTYYPNLPRISRKELWKAPVDDLRECVLTAFEEDVGRFIPKAPAR